MNKSSHSLIPNYHFVVSSPRSGSTWLARALNHHPELLATENRLFGMFCEIWENQNGKSAPRITLDRFLKGFSTHSFYEQLGYDTSGELESDLRAEFIQSLIRFLHDRSGKTIIVDKVTPYLGTAEQVLSLAQSHFDARFVHLVRDGRDVAVSGVFDWIARENKTSDRYRLFAEQQTGISLTRFFDDELLCRWAEYWSDTLTAFENGPNSVLEIRFESMLENQESVLNSIFQFLGVSHEQGLAEHCVAQTSFIKTTGRENGEVQPLAKQRKGIAGDWKNYFTRADARLFAELTGNWLQRFGYADDTSWIQDCPVQLNLTG